MASVIVVGGGLSGLVCARRLQQAGLETTILESCSRLGGHIVSDHVDGFVLDYGFQVYFDAYPSASLELQETALNLKAFEPGCQLFDGKRLRTVHKDNMLETVFGRWLPMADLIKVNQLSSDLKHMLPADLWSMEDETIETFLTQRGFSQTALDRFFQPFFGAIFLTKNLTDSCRPFCHYWRMLDAGKTVVPAAGMGAITDQVAAGLGKAKVSLGTAVESLVRNDGRVVGVKTAAGKTLKADFVVLACGPAATKSLGEVVTPSGAKSCASVHFSAPSNPIADPVVVCNASGTGDVSHVACVSGVARERAPKGRHLVTATSLDLPRVDDLTFAKNVRYELRSWFPKADVASWVPLRVDRIVNSQMPQPVGFLESRPDVSPEPGLVLAGELTTFAGIDGACRAGQNAATAVLQAMKEPMTA